MPDPEYTGESKAVHVELDSAGASPVTDGPITDSPSYLGRAPMFRIFPEAPSWDLQEHVTGPLYEGPHYKGMSQAIHVRGPVTTPTPPGSVPGCRCCAETGVGTTVISVGEHLLVTSAGRVCRVDLGSRASDGATWTFRAKFDQVAREVGGSWSVGFSQNDPLAPTNYSWNAEVRFLPANGGTVLIVKSNTTTASFTAYPTAQHGEWITLVVAISGHTVEGKIWLDETDSDPGVYQATAVGVDAFGETLDPGGTGRFLSVQSAPFTGSGPTFELPGTTMWDYIDVQGIGREDFDRTVADGWGTSEFPGSPPWTNNSGSGSVLVGTTTGSSGGGGGGGACITDTFTRTVAAPSSPGPVWGLSDATLPWRGGGIGGVGAFNGATAFVDGAQGVLKNAASTIGTGSSTRYAGCQANLNDDLTVVPSSGSVQVTFSGDPASLGSQAKIDLANSFIFMNGNSVTPASFFQVEFFGDGGTEVDFVPFSYGTSAWNVKWLETSSTLSAKIWRVGDPEPGSWTVSTTPDVSTTPFDPNFKLSLLDGFTTSGGHATAPQTVHWDNLDIDGVSASCPAVGDCSDCTGSIATGDWDPDGDYFTVLEWFGVDDPPPPTFIDPEVAVSADKLQWHGSIIPDLPNNDGRSYCFAGLSTKPADWPGLSLVAGLVEVYYEFTQEADHIVGNTRSFTLGDSDTDFLGMYQFGAFWLNWGGSIPTNDTFWYFDHSTALSHGNPVWIIEVGSAGAGGTNLMEMPVSVADSAGVKFSVRASINRGAVLPNKFRFKVWRTDVDPEPPLWTSVGGPGVPNLVLQQVLSFGYDLGVSGAEFGGPIPPIPGKDYHWTFHLESHTFGTRLVENVEVNNVALGPATQECAQDCVECIDPLTGGAIPDFTPGFLPTFRRQIGDPTTSLDSFICTMESAAMVLDWHTRGAISVWGGELIPWCGKTVAQIEASGTNLGNAAQAWAHYGQVLSIRSGQTFDAMLACLAEGRAVILQGDYATFSNAIKCQDSFEGFHAISVYPYQVADRLLVGDPLCSTFYGVPIAALRAYAESFGAAAFGSSSPQPILFAVSRPWSPAP